jgi:hypothetical protein
LSIFFGAAGIVWLDFLPSGLFSYYNWGSILCVMNLTSLPFLSFLVIFLLKAVGLKGRINFTVLTYIYTVAMTCSWYVSTWCPFEWSDIIASRHMASDWSARYVPWFMAPPEDITRQILTGHVPIPWAEWIPSIVYHWLLFVLLGSFYISVATLFRRHWIDVEKVPFPHAILAYELLKRIPDGGKPLKERLGFPFMLGIVLGLAFQIPVFMASMFPWFPDVYGWRTQCLSGQWYVTPDNPLTAIAGLSTFQKHPVMIAIGYIAPLTISFNAWFWHLIYIILMQAAYVMGFYTGIEGIGGCGRAWCMPSGQTQPPFKFMALSYGGGLLGLAVIQLYLSRRYIVDTFKAALGRHGIENEDKEALNYRGIYVMLAITFILLVALFMTIGIGIAPALLLVISYFLFWMANTRIYGLAGIQARGAEHGNTLMRLIVWPTAPDPPTREYVLAAYYSRRGMDSPDAISGGTIFSAFNVYKMASLTGASNKAVLKIMLTSTVITQLVVYVTHLSLLYSFGGSALGPNASSEVTTNQFYNYSNPANWIRFPGTEPLLPYVLAGFLIVCSLDYLHARFLWFPFEPIGFIIGTSYISVLWGYWGPFLIAWILKTLTLRMGGSRLYEEYGMPLAGGFVAGYMIAVLIGGGLGIIRFFIPF